MVVKGTEKDGSNHRKIGRKRDGTLKEISKQGKVNLHQSKKRRK